MISEIEKQNYTFIEKEIFEALSTCREQFKLMVQIITLLITANLTLIGFVFSSNKTTLLCYGAIFPFLIIVTRIVSNSLMVPIIYTAYHLEQKLDIKDTDLLASTFIEITYGKSFIKLNQICKKETHSERINGLIKLSSWKHTLFIKSNRIVTFICLVAFIAQIILPLLT